MRTPTLHFAGFLFAALQTLSAQGAEGWFTDFNAAQEQSRKLNRPMIVHFHTTWCGPCKRMERDVLNSPEVRQLLQSQVIGVKVDADQNPALRVRYNVGSFPTDIVLHPDGRKLHEVNGAQPKVQYVATVAQFKLPPPRTVEAKTAIASSDDHQTIETASQVEIGMDGFCPVTLHKTRAWKEGRKEFHYDYEGQRFYLASAKDLQTFKANPAKYAPRILGCDPVSLTTRSEALPGTTKFAAYFDGGLYLFRDDASRKQFRKDPTKFTRIQTVKIESKKASG